MCNSSKKKKMPISPTKSSTRAGAIALCILRDFCYGLRDSLRGLLVLHRFWQRSKTGGEKSKKTIFLSDEQNKKGVDVDFLKEEEQEEKEEGIFSVVSRNNENKRKKPVVSVLEARRRRRLEEQCPGGSQLKRLDEKRVAPNQKSSALKLILRCFCLNILCILLLNYALIPLAGYLTQFFCNRILLGRGGGGAVLNGQSHNKINNSNNNNNNLQNVARLISGLMGSFAVLPLFLVSRILNALWFADIAGESSRRLFPSIGKGGGNFSISSRSVADFVLAIVLETLFFAQALLSSLLPLPYLAQTFCLVHLSLLYSLYSFEYFWVGRQLQLKARLRRIETYWPYYLGFGTPMTLLTSISSNFIINGCLFGALFPLYIISSCQVPFNAPPFISDQYSSDSVPPVRIFAPSMAFTNKLSKYVVFKLNIKSTNFHNYNIGREISPVKKPASKYASKKSDS